MEKKYIVSVDQSTQGTKALLLDRTARIVGRASLPHRQIIHPNGWVSHDPEEIYRNTVGVVQHLLKDAQADPEEVSALGISNQRETALIWNRETGRPLDLAVVWQCSRGQEITDLPQVASCASLVKELTGIPLSPYFSAAKIAWLIRHHPDALSLSESGNLCAGTVDSWLVFRLTGGKEFRTDYSNASRTQLLNLHTLQWDGDLCRIFGIPLSSLAQICDSNALFGTTDMEGIFPEPVPIFAVMGDSHSALYGHGCRLPGQLKVTYGTGSSVMMNIGEKPLKSSHGLVTSVAWGINGKISYVTEGNITYTGAVISWLKDNLGLLAHARESQALAMAANPNDTTYFIPAFTGLGAPYWEDRAKAMIYGMSRTTGTAEFVRAAEESIAYQIADVIFAMEKDTGLPMNGIFVDGGPTRDSFLMQFQSDILDRSISVPDAEELSGIGAAYMSGEKTGLFTQKEIDSAIRYTEYRSQISEGQRKAKYGGWQKAVQTLIRSL